jgi:hypothetical protein
MMTKILKNTLENNKMTHYLVPIKRKSNREYLEIGVKDNHLYFKEENDQPVSWFKSKAFLTGGGGPTKSTLHRLVQEIAATRNKKFSAIISEKIIEVTEGVGRCLK